MRCLRVLEISFLLMSNDGDDDEKSKLAGISDEIGYNNELLACCNGPRHRKELQWELMRARATPPPTVI